MHRFETGYIKCYTHRRRNRPFVDGYGTKEFVNTKTSGGGTLLDKAIYSLGRMMYLSAAKGCEVTAADIEAVPPRVTRS